MAEPAGSEIAHLDRQERLGRLNELLRRSLLYTEFLYKRTSQAQEAQETERTPEKKAYGTRCGKPRKLGKRGAESPAQADSCDSIPDAKREKKTLVVTAQQPGLVVGGTMREYQLAGLAWLKSLYENGLHGILADEMGLGKTIQTISLLAHLYEQKVQGPYLVVAPLSTLSNWHKEFSRWAPSIPVILYHGSPSARTALRKKIGASSSSGTLPTVLTTYEIVLKDSKYLQKFAWKYLVVDEGHRLKNMNCKLIKELKKYSSANRLLLTGTPLQNNLQELWSLLNFLLPDVFDDLELFQEWFDVTNFDSEQSEDEEAGALKGDDKNHIIAQLHRILEPFLLRRLKADVDLQLPPKNEVTVYAQLTEKVCDVTHYDFGAWWFAVGLAWSSICTLVATLTRYPGIMHRNQLAFQFHLCVCKPFVLATRIVLAADQQDARGHKT
eukprot:m.247717 g.247717  ORF g.247717 m.247717 type:complete len:440 (-) comp15399_c1_seq1:2252-3571(-)